MCTVSTFWTGAHTSNRQSVLNQLICLRMPTRHGGRVVKIASVVLALVCVPVSYAQDGDALDEIRAEMARLREENARIRGELDRMNRARDPELDRLMRAQIGMAVDAAMAQVQSEQQMTGGWNDGFFLASEDGKFSMELGLWCNSGLSTPTALIHCVLCKIQTSTTGKIAGVLNSPEPTCWCVVICTGPNCSTS